MNNKEKENVKKALLALDAVCGGEIRKEILKDTLKEAFSRVKSVLRHITHEVWALKRAGYYEVAVIDDKLSQQLDDIEQEFLKGE